MDDASSYKEKNENSIYKMFDHLEFQKTKVTPKSKDFTFFLPQRE